MSLLFEDGSLRYRKEVAPDSPESPRFAVKALDRRWNIVLSKERGKNNFGGQPVSHALRERGYKRYAEVAFPSCLRDKSHNCDQDDLP